MRGVTAASTILQKLNVAEGPPPVAPASEPEKK
jgi:hypothetical protein